MSVAGDVASPSVESQEPRRDGEAEEGSRRPRKQKKEAEALDNRSFMK